jgi:F-type H+-transporting ATPase subunit alpha
VAGKIKGQLAQYRELAAFAQFGSDLDPKTKSILDRGARIVEIFNQKQYNPVPLELQVAVLWAVQNDFFDKIPVAQVKDFQDKLAAVLTKQYPNILQALREKQEKGITEDIAKDLKNAVSQFAESYA